MRPQAKIKHDTNSIGDISEATITARLLQIGYVVLIPYGGNQRYDLIIEDLDGHLWRIQCKTASINASSTILTFNTSIRNVTGKNRQLRHYRGQCDYFAAYNAEIDRVYLVPVSDVGITRAHLRLTPPKNGNQQEYRMASDYEL